jgi:hypothetical protein
MHHLPLSFQQTTQKQSYRDLPYVCVKNLRRTGSLVLSLSALHWRASQVQVSLVVATRGLSAMVDYKNVKKQGRMYWSEVTISQLVSRTY